MIISKKNIYFGMKASTKGWLVIAGLVLGGMIYTAYNHTKVQEMIGKYIPFVQGLFNKKTQ